MFVLKCVKYTIYCTFHVTNIPHMKLIGSSVILNQSQLNIFSLLPSMFLFICPEKRPDGQVSGNFGGGERIMVGRLEVIEYVRVQRK